MQDLEQPSGENSPVPKRLKAIDSGTIPPNLSDYEKNPASPKGKKALPNQPNFTIEHFFRSSFFTQWEFKFLTASLTKHNLGLDASTQAKFIFDDRYRLIPECALFENTSKFSAETDPSNLTNYPSSYPIISIVSNSYELEKVRNSMSHYPQMSSHEKFYKLHIIATFGPTDLFANANYYPSSVITIYDHQTQQVQKCAWHLFGIKFNHPVLLGITPKHFLKGEHDPNTLLGKSDPLYLRMMIDFVVQEETEKKIRAKTSPKVACKLNTRTTNPPLHQSTFVDCLQKSEDPEFSIASSQFKLLGTYINKVPAYHSAKGDFSATCIMCSDLSSSNKPQSCIDHLTKLTTHHLSQEQRQLYGRAAKYAQTLLPFVTNAQLSSMVASALTCLARPVMHNSHTKPINSTIHLLSQCIKANTECVGMTILTFFLNNTLNPSSTLASSKFRDKLLTWTSDIIDSSSSDTWISIAEELGMETPPKVTYLDSTRGSSLLLPSEPHEPLHNLPPLQIGAYNVNGLKTRWGKDPHLLPDIPTPSLRDKRSLPFKEVVHLMETPDVLFVLETKCNMLTMCKLPGFLAWRKRTGYTHLYSTWSNNARKGGAGYCGVTAFSKLPPLEVVYGFVHKPQEFENEYEGRLITLIYGSLIVIGTYTPCAGYDQPRLTFKLSFERELQEHIKTLRLQYVDRPFVLTGDLNVNPLPSDCHPNAFSHIPGSAQRSPPHPGCRPEEVHAYNTTCATFDGVNLFEHLHPMDPHCQTWVSPLDPLGNKEWGQRIDHSVVTKSLVDGTHTLQAVNMEVFKLGSSDHYPILTRLRPLLPGDEKVGTISQASHTLRVLGHYRAAFDKCKLNTLTSDGRVHHIRPSTLPVVTLTVLGPDSKKITIPSFLDTGAPCTLLNPGPGLTALTDPLMCELARSSGWQVTTPFQVYGVGGGKITLDKSTEVRFDLGLPEPITTQVAFLPAHEPTLPRFLLGMDTIYHTFKGVSLEQGRGGTLKVSFAISPDQVFDGSGRAPSDQFSVNKIDKFISRQALLSRPECEERDMFDKAFADDSDTGDNITCWEQEAPKEEITLKAKSSTIIPPKSHSRIYIEKLSTYDLKRCEGLDIRISQFSEAKEYNIGYGPVDSQNIEWVQVGNLTDHPIHLARGESIAKAVCYQSNTLPSPVPCGHFGTSIPERRYPTDITLIPRKEYSTNPITCDSSQVTVEPVLLTRSMITVPLGEYVARLEVDACEDDTQTHDVRTYLDLAKTFRRSKTGQSVSTPVTCRSGSCPDDRDCDSGTGASFKSLLSDVITQTPRDDSTTPTPSSPRHYVQTGDLTKTIHTLTDTARVHLHHSDDTHDEGRSGWISSPPATQEGDPSMWAYGDIDGLQSTRVGKDCDKIDSKGVTALIHDDDDIEEKYN